MFETPSLLSFINFFTHLKILSWTLITFSMLDTLSRGLGIDDRGFCPVKTSVQREALFQGKMCEGLYPKRVWSVFWGTSNIHPCSHRMPQVIFIRIKNVSALLMSWQNSCGNIVISINHASEKGGYSVCFPMFAQPTCARVQHHTLRMPVRTPCSLPSFVGTGEEANE